uniref:MULE transposase domain-containing protein n=1 Tax=Mycena chlorophos TaxID=658473 RepID=A0ABQ0LR20_MYCCL|nr:predicted protein [Mycena chlorophos]
MADEANALVRELASHTSPSDIAKRVREDHLKVSNAQVYNAWRTVVEAFWKRDQNQLVSAEKLLREYEEVVDVFTPTGIPADVEILCWGMKIIASRLQTHVIEVAMDATYNTNARQLELYAVMAEYDNAGFPLAYCLLSTTSAISPGKRKKSLTAFTACLRDAYNIHPEFTHVDKDLGEITALQSVWKDAKVSICWWHVDDAVGKRIRNSKLSTTPYKVKRAHHNFTFIALDFLPRVRADKAEYEGGKPDDEVSNDEEPLPPTQNPLRLIFKLKKAPPRKVDANGIPLLHLPRVDDIFYDNDEPEQPSEEGEGDGSEASDLEPWPAMGEKRKHTGNTDSRHFCPEELQSKVLSLMQQHSFRESFAHPLIPGFSAPTPDAICYWAIKQAYALCHKNDSPELWAYLWENWYRTKRWELWTRSSHSSIPRLRTTMISESHW